MGLSGELKTAVANVFREKWKERDGLVVPEPDALGLDNDAVKLNATVLYADLAESTQLVDGHKRWFSAEIYKVYLGCAAKVIRSEGGEITAYDGDRIMAVFLGDFKNTRAARAALKINWVVQNVINPAIAANYTDTIYRMEQAVGIDTSDLFVARTGIRGSNDLVWVGPAANYAAKLCGLREGNYATWISDTAHKMLQESLRYTNSQSMWEQRTWTAKNRTVFRSNWTWPIS